MTATSSPTERIFEIVDNLIKNKVIRSERAFANAIGIEQPSLSAAKAGKRNIPEKKYDLIVQMYGANINFIKTGDLPMFTNEVISKNDSKNTNIESDAIVIGEIPEPGNTAVLTNNRFLKLIPLVPLEISAGYVEHFHDPVFINEEFEQFPFIATSPGRGNYIAFIVKGHSMENGTDESINDGSIVVGREIQKHHWRSPLHLHRFEDYVIIHKEIMTCKRITEHDTENGIIHCTSLNPDKNKYRDFDLYLDDCLQLFNIISVTKTR